MAGRDRALTYLSEVKWLIALLVAAGCPASPPPPAPPPPGAAPTGPPGEVIGHHDPEADPEPEPEPGPEPEPEPEPEREPEPAPEPVRSKDPEPGPLRGILRAHNQARAKHCAAPLEWSPRLAALAQKWADTLAARGCAFEHSPDNRFGENLAGAAPAGTHTANSATAAWYREVDVYDFSKGRFSFEAGHFTQLVWRKTRRLGCGYARCSGDRAEIWVCNYDPPGNVSGAFRENVLPASCND